MNNKARLVIAVCASMVVGAVPIALSVVLAQHQGRVLEEERLLGYAANVLYRSERASQQVFAGIDRLNQARKGDPCSPAQMALMAEIDLSSTDIQTMGYIVADRLVCASVGSFGAGLPITTESEHPVGKDGVEQYTRAQLSIAPGMHFTIVARGGYAAVIHEAIPLDVTTDSDTLSLATYSLRNNGFRSTRGVVKKEWLSHLSTERPTTFDDGERLVALVASQNFPTVTVAAAPMSDMLVQTRKMLGFLLPFGVAAGLALGVAAFLMARRHMGMPALLRRALNKRELFLLYQPIVDLHNGRCIGAEALIRWRRADGSMVPPDVFIPVAEASGLIQRVTEQVLERVAADAGSLFADYPAFHIGINLAAADLQSTRTVELLDLLMRKTGAGAHNLLVEATERGLMDAAEVREVINAIHALGIEVAVDDFGTGYSSLSYLETFALDYLKIDKSFVDTLAIDAATSQVALHIIEMAKSLKLKMIAEGVETEAQARLLQERGVQFAQGWLFARPMTMAALREHMARQDAQG
ncbi:EAL domain-containing protein [Rhodoferax saidenbachensis]|uniref:EAL domain-containing protein n=1 Tax=Rhodoferax saidenbachensis TaxID=1484693 RepID=UPI0004AEFFB1|nr:EAL domain-containing protein [Rhodoferax saidenbachensis]